MKTVLEVLDSQEAVRLESLEGTLQKARETLTAQFVIVGSALKQIRDEKLYRQHGTFEEYVITKWDICKARAYQLIQASDVAKNVQNILDVPNASIANELGKLPTAKLQKKAARGIVKLSQRKDRTRKFVGRIAGPVTTKKAEKIVRQIQTKARGGLAAEYSKASNGDHKPEPEKLFEPATAEVETEEMDPISKRLARQKVRTFYESVKEKWNDEFAKGRLTPMKIADQFENLFA